MKDHGYSIRAERQRAMLYIATGAEANDRLKRMVARFKGKKCYLIFAWRLLVR